MQTLLKHICSPQEQTSPLKEYFHAGPSAARHQALLPEHAPAAT